MLNRIGTNLLPIIKKLLKRRAKRKFRKQQRKKSGKWKPPICFNCNKTGHFSNQCRLKNKIKQVKELDLDDQTRETLLKIMLEPEESSIESSEFSDDLDFIQNEEITTSEESELDEPSCSCNNLNEKNNEEEEYYNILSQFTEHHLNVLDALNLIQLLNAVKGTEMEGQVIDLIHEKFKYTHEHESNQDSEKLKFNQYFQNQKEGNHSRTPELTRDLTPYTIAEVRRRVELKQKESFHVPINDLQIEVKNLK